MRLTNPAPLSIEIDGADYVLDVSFRSALLTFLAFRDSELSDMEKAGIMVHNLFDGEEDYPPELWNKLVEKAVWFLRCGETDGKEKPEKKPVVDFEFDGQRIIDAFNAKGINLDEIENMHLWTFMSHFKTLPDCELKRIFYLRHLHNTGKLTKKEHKHDYEDAKQIGMEIIKMKSRDISALERIEKLRAGTL